MRVFLTGCALVALAACQPAIPDSAAGVGFDNDVNSAAAQQQRDAALAGATEVALPPAQAVSDETLATLQRTSTTASSTAPTANSVGAPLATTALADPSSVPQTQPSAAPITSTTTLATATAAAAAATSEPAAPSRISANKPQTTPDGIVHASPSNPAPVLMNNPGISDENNFEAVGSRRSIDADAERLANARANYKVIAPTAVPLRQGDKGPNIVAYALSTSNPVGSKIYSRVGLKSTSRYEKACAKFPSSSEAQAAFLKQGGPKKDRLGVDPDGDGFACAWDPSPYRQAAGS